MLVMWDNWFRGSCCRHSILLIAEKELNELLKEVFDGYESDTSETLATADADVRPDDVQLTPADGVNTESGRSSRDVTPRKLRSTDRGNDDDGGEDHKAEANCLLHQDAENDRFQYPGHIPPLKYVSVSLCVMKYQRCQLLAYVLLFYCSLLRGL